MTDITKNDDQIVYDNKKEQILVDKKEQILVDKEEQILVDKEERSPVTKVSKKKKEKPLIKKVVQNETPIVRTAFEQLESDSTYSGHEESVRIYWNEIGLPKLLKQSNNQANNQPMKKFNFMDGPPFVSGKLHYGHVAVGSYKSAVCNVARMFGLDSSYFLGFDCHGLPIEGKVMKDNKLERDDVKKMGLRNFNALCDSTIMNISSSWKPLFEKFGRLVDFESTYMTRDLDFMETTIWIFKQLFTKGLVYSGNKVMSYSPALETPLSNFEAGQNYQDIVTKSIYVRFEVQSDLSKLNVTNEDGVQTFFVAWTTTPWTLPSNLALCVNASVTYVVIEDLDNKNARYIISKNSIANLFGKKRVQNVKILSEFQGDVLENMHYTPLFPYMKELNLQNNLPDSNFFRILCDPYVKDDEIGTAVVHQAPAFGEDDFRVCEKYGIVSNVNISSYCPVDAKCRFTEVCGEYYGKFVLDADADIRSYLQFNKKIVKIQEYKHSYPHCYRTDTPLIYRTVKSFFINIQELKSRMIELNKKVTWYPSDIANRFGAWIESPKDWAVSRFRDYGTPIPIWINDNDPNDMICVGSIDELAELTGIPRELITNLHPEFLNEMKIVSASGAVYTRVPDILDCWFESGSVPFAQIHYPFDKERAALLDASEFLSEFVCEGLDQIRCWFYTLFVISTAIADKPPFKHVVSTGMVMDEQGRKLSKRLNNFEDPEKLINDLGADFIRIYFIRSPLMNAEPLNFNKVDITRLKNRIVPYINAVKFLIEHTLNLMANGKTKLKFGQAYQELELGQIKNFMDRWLLNKVITICQKVTELARTYRMGQAVDCLVESIDELTNWYLKLNRDRLKGNNGQADQIASLSTLYTVLLTFTQLWAPFTPFLSEYLFQRLRTIHVDPSIANSQSVLLTRFPTFMRSNVDQSILTEMHDLQRVSQMVRTLRSSSSNHTSIMVPFKSCTISHADSSYLSKLQSVIQNVQAELNVNEFEFEILENNIDLTVKVNNRELGKTYRADAKIIQNTLSHLSTGNLYQLYSKQTKTLVIAYNVNDTVKTIEFGYPNEYFELVPIPKKNSESGTLIDKDLMIKVDTTYNNQINHVYYSRLLHSAIQNSRKTMNLRPWQKVVVIIDTRICKGALSDVIADLRESLPWDTTELMEGSFDETDLEGLEFGVPSSNDVSTTLVEKFTWKYLLDDSYNSVCEIEGYFGVYCYKT